MDFSMAMRMQRMGIRPMAIGARRSGNNLGTEAIHLYRRKMTKMQQTGIRLMAIGAQRMDSGPRAKANCYIREARRKGKSLKKYRCTIDRPQSEGYITTYGKAEGCC